uniref:Lin-5 (Five) Interacting protein n=2 Tax=Caenorhabditis japonica TaxID=281687 RepID=A0A8R1I3G8_CAEJA
MLSTETESHFPPCQFLDELSASCGVVWCPSNFRLGVVVVRFVVVPISILFFLCNSFALQTNRQTTNSFSPEINRDRGRQAHTFPNSFYKEARKKERKKNKKKKKGEKHVNKRNISSSKSPNLCAPHLNSPHHTTPKPTFYCSIFPSKINPHADVLRWMFFSCGVNSSSPGRQLVVSESAPEGVLRDPPSQALRTLSPISPPTASSSSSTSRSCSPVVRAEAIVPGKWTHISGKVSVRPLTPSETESVLERQRQRRKKSRKDKLKMDTNDDTRSSGGDGAIHIPSGESKEPTPESPGSRSNYGEFYCPTDKLKTYQYTIHMKKMEEEFHEFDGDSWDEYSRDTSGENNYHHTSSFDDDLLLEIDNSRGAAVARLDRTQDDLNKFRQRIDNNVEQQKEYSEMMAALQNKVHEYRKHIAELEGRMVGTRNRMLDDPSSNVLIFDNYDPGNTYITNHNVEMWSPARGKRDTLLGGGPGGLTTVNVLTGSGGAGGYTSALGSHGLTGSGVAGYGGGVQALAGDPNANYEMIAKLDEERRRADEYRMQWENERQKSLALEDENDRLRREFERYATDSRDKEKTFINRERNLAQYLSDEQRKMLDLWTELQRVRKQFSDLKSQTEDDLDKQKSEFTRALRNVSNISRNANVSGGVGDLGIYGLDDGTDTNKTTHNYEKVLIETVKRMAGNGGAPGSSSADLLEELRKIRGGGSSEGDAEIHKELMKKYEESIERNIELESKGDDSQRKIAELEAELRRNREKLNEAQSALKKLHEMAQDSEKNVDGSVVTVKRTRSLSPGKTPLPPAEALRAVRNTFRNKDNDIQQLERKLKIAESQVKEFLNKFENADEARRRLDKQFADAKREVSNLQKNVDEAERNSRRVEDKLRASEAERVAAEKARKFLEDELAKLQASFQKSSSDDVRKLRDEMDEHANSIQEEYKVRIDELNRRIENLLRENNRLKSEANPLKDKYRDLENEFNSIQRRIEEKETQIRYSDDIRRNIQKDMDDLREKYDRVHIDNEKILSELEHAQKAAHLAEQQLKEIKVQRDDYQKQKDEQSRHLFDIRHKLETEIKGRQDLEKHGVRNNDELDKLRQANSDYESQINLLRRHNDELDTTIKGHQGKITQLENELHSRSGEIEKLNDLNQRLQKEKQEVLNQKLKLDGDIQALKETIRKLENELEKLRSENKELAGKEARARDAANQHLTRANLLTKELEDNKQDLKHSNEVIKQLEQDIKDLKDRLANIGRTGRISRDSTQTGIAGRDPRDISGSEGGAFGDRSALGDSTRSRGAPGSSIYVPSDDVTREGDEINVPTAGDVIHGRDGKDGTTGNRGTHTIVNTKERIERIEKNILDRYHDDELAEHKIREINDRWKRELERLENEKDDLERRIRELDDELSRIGRGNDKQENDITELKRKHAAEIDKLKSDISIMHDKHLSDLDDEKEQYGKAVDNLKSVEDNLRDKLNTLEKQLADSLNRENELEREKRDYDEKINSLYGQNQKIKDEWDDFRNDADKEIQKWKTDSYTVRSEAKALETTNTALKAQLQAANDRVDHLTKTVNDQTSKVRDLTSQIRRLEDELSDNKGNLVQKEMDLESAQNRLRSLEEQYSTLQSDANKWRGELDAALRENDVLKSNNTNLESDLNRFKNRLKAAEDALKDLKNSLGHAKTEKERLQNAFREKTKQADHLNQLASQFDSKLAKLRNELQITNDKLITSDTERTALRNELQKLTQELKFGNEQIQRKSDEYQTTIDDLAHSHRVSEDSRLNALQDLEARKYEINDLTSRLDSTEQRLATLQQDYIKADSERDLLSDALRRFQSSANRVINLHTFVDGAGYVDGVVPGYHQTDINIHTGGAPAGGQSVLGGGPLAQRAGAYDPSSGPSGIGSGIGGGQGGPDFGRDVEIGRGDLDSSDGVAYPRSVPFPPSADYTSGRPGATSAGGRVINNLDGTTTVNMNGGFDITNLESTLQSLLNKIEKLEMERNELRDTLARMKKKTTETHTTINQKETRYRNIEDNLQDAEEEKRALESRLQSAKTLLRSQEEALKQRDEERRQMKSKMVAAELQARGKEAQLRHLNEQLKNLRTDLDNAHTDIRSLRDKEEQWDSSRFQLETKMRESDSDSGKLQLQIATFESERQTLTEKIKELDGALRLSDTKVQDMKDDTDKLRRDLIKAESVENELRKTIDIQSKTSHEYQLLKDQLVNTQNELNGSNTRKQQLENELLNARSEIRDTKQRVHDVNNRVSELQRQLQDANSEKNRLEDRLLSSEKIVNTQRTTETDLRQQLETAKNDKRVALKELEDIKRRLSQLENERRNASQLSDSWKKEKATLVKKIEIMENDKRRTDAAIRETALQREAIEKSLNAMERENKELYKNCAQLQQQIAQLEMENGNRILELTNKQREEQERQLIRMRQEKGQIEKVIENRERTHRNRIKQLEDQIVILRDQLDGERRRRREYVDRSMVNDIGRLGSNVLGIRSSYVDNNIDNIIHGGSRSVGFYPRSTFASNPLTPPLGTSTPTHRPIHTDFRSAVDAGSSYRRPISTIEDTGMEVTFNTYPPAVPKHTQNTPVIRVHRSKSREVLHHEYIETREMHEREESKEGQQIHIPAADH